MTDSCCVELIQVEDGTTLFLTAGQGGGVGGGGTPLHLAYWRTSGALGSTGGATWDDDNSELDVSGPGTNNGTIWGDATGASGTGVTGTGDASGGTGVYGRGAADGVYGTSSAGIGVQGVTTTGTAVDARPQSSGSIGLHVGALHTGAQPVVVDQQASPTQPAFLGRINSVDTVALSPSGKGGGYFNSAALANNATGGFVGLPSCPGTPTGTPTGYPSGVIPALIKSGDGSLWIYVSGAWAQASGGGGGSVTFADEEVPTGSINGSNVTFTLAHTPTAGSVKLFQNRTRLQGGGVDYSVSTATITMGIAPATGDTLFADYRY